MHAPLSVGGLTAHREGFFSCGTEGEDTFR
jgi:hypothetical protein